MLFRSKELRDKCIKSIANYYINYSGATLRSAAREFGISKSTVYKMFRDELPSIDSVLYAKVVIATSNNIEQRSIRGNIAMLKNRNHYICNDKKGEVYNGYTEKGKIQEREYQNEIINNF